MEPPEQLDWDQTRPCTMVEPGAHFPADARRRVGQRQPGDPVAAAAAARRARAAAGAAAAPPPQPAAAAFARPRRRRPRPAPLGAARGRCVRRGLGRPDTAPVGARGGPARHPKGGRCQDVHAAGRRRRGPRRGAGPGACRLPAGRRLGGHRPGPRGRRGRGAVGARGGGGGARAGQARVAPRGRQRGHGLGARPGPTGEVRPRRAARAQGEHDATRRRRRGPSPAGATR
jgi:hypothetical protein